MNYYHIVEYYFSIQGFELSEEKLKKEINDILGLTKLKEPKSEFVKGKSSLNIRICVEALHRNYGRKIS